MKTIELLNKVVKLGFDREKALEDIDASLDEIIGAENRKPITEQKANHRRGSQSQKRKSAKSWQMIFCLGLNVKKKAIKKG